METIVKNDILSILKKTEDALRMHNSFVLYELSNHTIHNSSVFQDEDSVSIAVLVYAISKIIQRKGYIDPKLTRYISDAYSYLSKEDIEAYRNMIKKIFRIISEHDKKMNLYIQEVINHAEVNKGSKIYEHGISLSRAAEIMGVSQWDIMKYAGASMKIDGLSMRVDVKDRLKFVRSLFGLR